MKGAANLTLVALIVASGLAAVATPAAANGSFVAVDVQSTPDPAQPGTEVTVTTTVENIHDEGDVYRLQRVALRETESGNGTEYDSKNPSTVVNTGETVTTNLSEEFDKTGEFQRYVHLKFISSGDQVLNIVRPVTVTVQQSHPAMSLSSNKPIKGGKTDLSLTVANGLPDTVRGVTVEFESDDVEFRENRRVISSLESGQQADVTVPIRNVSTGPKAVTATLSYLTADGESRTVTETLSTSIENEGNPARISLTGIRITEENDEIVVRGSASNVGANNASSILISVADGESVSPAQNQASYFVGEVKASDYSSFEVHGTLTADGNETITIPLTVEYDVDGDHVSRTVEVDYTPESANQDVANNKNSSSSVLPAAIGGVIVLVVGGLGWRRFQ